VQGLEKKAPAERTGFRNPGIGKQVRPRGQSVRLWGGRKLRGAPSREGTTVSLAFPKARGNMTRVWALYR